MTENKPVSKKVFSILAILCIAALIGLNISVITYFSDINAKNETITQKDQQIIDLQTQIANLTAATGPKLVSIGLQYTDNRTLTNSSFLHVTGYVCNVGNARANNCVIRISAIQNGNITAIDTSAVISAIEAGAYKLIDIQFPYAGQPLIAYSAYLDWTS
jgi:hypothetical protein